MDEALGSCGLDELRKRRSVKWTRHPPDVLPAWVAEMDYDLAAPVVEALREATEAGDAGYANPVGFGAPFAAFARSRWSWAVEPARVFALPDVMSGMAEVVTAVTDPGAGVVVNPPVYPPFFSRTALAGRRIVEAPLARKAEGRYDLDFDAIDAALGRDGVAAYLLCNPHNPVGRVWSRRDLMTVADLCQHHGTWLLADEIHAPLALGGAAHVPFLSLDHETAERTVVFSSASKGWNIPGLKCALAVTASAGTHRLLAKRWEALLPSHFGVLATMAAFGRSTAWLDTVRAQLDENRWLLRDLLATELPAVGYVPPEASFLAWLDCRELGMGDDPAAGFLERGRVALSPGPGFGSQGRGWARLNIGTSPQLIEEAVDRMASALRRGAG
ncbi:MAG TPA: aminotransferase class I/II-fold pyridoxal phosphate-dependent enzyme [Acidimicrobiales bacterium]|nr:aminotransferase class I/II-fold pyridoxal phosphate-dependent enzyme [Acidimicrobiales bacterium]